MKFLNGLFKKKTDDKEVLSELEVLRRQINLLHRIIHDYQTSPAKYQQQISGSCADAYTQMCIDKTKLEMRYLYLTKYL